MKTPSIPPTFWKGVVVAILAVAAAIGLPVDDSQKQALDVIAETLPVAIIVGGTILHAVRAIYAPQVVAAKAVQAQADAKAAEAAVVPVTDEQKAA